MSLVLRAPSVEFTQSYSIGATSNKLFVAKKSLGEARNVASIHGFRIYVVQTFLNSIKDNEPECVASDSPARERIVSLLDALHEAESHHLAPQSVREDEPEKPTRTVTVGEPIVVREDLVHVVVSLGELGSHRRATRAKKKPKDLKKWSPEAEHNLTFLFPKDGDEFVLVSQTTRRRDPVPELFRLLTQLGLEQKKKARKAEDERRQRGRIEGKPIPKRVVHSRLLFVRRQAVDNSYIDEIIGSAKSATAVFQSKVPSDRGGSRPVVKRTLQIRLRDENEREIGRTLGKRWFQRTRDGESSTAAEGVSELAGLLSDEDLFEDDEARRYNAASIAVHRGRYSPRCFHLPGF
ncbi:hypothetical protein [Pseudarthrobacter oxydans]|uniref:hypothetical protein n=1 Tax=Pseudarthrobacter oxydans TaxID=1671 RepID=UPI0038197A81